MTQHESVTSVTPETWRPVAGFEGVYEVSDLGRVRSLRWHGRLLMATPGHTGYPEVFLRWGRERRRRITVHRLVLETFVGACPVGMCCRHLDGNRRNARLDNLRWGTPKENSEDSARHGTMVRGTRTLNAALTEQRVRQIFLMDRAGHSRASIARSIPTSPGNVSLILRGLRWKNVAAEFA